MLKKFSENLGKGMSFGEAMRSVGYSQEYSEVPDQLKDTDSWKALLEQDLPDELLTKVHKGLLKHKDWRARDAGLDKGYKLKSKYGATKFTHTIKRNLGEIEDEIAEALSEIGEIVQ